MKMRSLLAGTGVAAIAIVGAGWLDKPDAPSPAVPPVSVAVENARSSARQGELVTYRTTVHNRDRVKRHLTITQLVPSALNVLASKPAAAANAGQVAWDILLGPGESRTLTTTGRVGQARDGYERLTTSTCVDSGSLRACDSDSDLLSASSAPSGGRPYALGGLVLGLAAIGAGLIALTRWARRNPTGSDAGRLPLPVRGNANWFDEVVAGIRRLRLDARTWNLRIAPLAIADGGGRSGHARSPPDRLACRGLC